MAISTAMKNTLYTVLAAVLISILGATATGLVKAQAALSQLSVNTSALSINTQAIKNIGTAMELRGIDRIIESKEQEIRANEVKIAINPDNMVLIEVLNSQSAKLEKEIEAQKAIRLCVTDPVKEVCK